MKSKNRNKEEGKSKEAVQYKIQWSIADIFISIHSQKARSFQSIVFIPNQETYFLNSYILYE